VCILGQAGGNYYNVRDFAKLSLAEASRLGFYIDALDYGLDEYNYEAPDEDWSMLTEVWVITILQLRAERDEAMASQIALDRVSDVQHGRANIADYPGMQEAVDNLINSGTIKA
jgi:hypothetical protein